jgi:methylase of polypeptide subunit release factors
MRSRHTVTGSQRRQAHIDWLKLIEVSGPFLSVPVLSAEWPDLESVDISTRDRLRQEHRAWQESPVKHRDEWIDFVLHDLLGWRDAARRNDMDRLALPEPLHDTAITPAFSLIDPTTGTIRLLGIVSAGSPVARIKGSNWAATPADRLVRLCRHHGTELGLATDGRWWALVWAPPEEITTVAVFDAMSWPDSSERIVVRAFISLLQRRRFFAVPPSRQLPALLRESVRHQEDITEQLGVQVRHAVEVLVAAFARAEIPASVTAAEVYRGAVAVMMRIVFLLFAEESGLLAADNELYARSYSAGGLYAELEQQVAYARGNEAELDHTHLAWHRLLALFTVIYRGVAHPDLGLIAHDGSLFDPDAHPWFPLTVDDRTVLHMLRAVQRVMIAGELRAVSFRTLTVEQIGYVYEGLLSFQAFRAVDIVVGLIGREGRDDEVPLRKLESMSAEQADLAVQLAGGYKDSGIGSVRLLTEKLAPLAGEERAQAETRLYAVTRDHVLVQRLLPFYRIIRQDLRGDPVVILPGTLYVSKSGLRASTGTHYTPRPLAEQVAEDALEPLVYYPGPLQTADDSKWQLRTADEILALRVADIAMGSGAFLVAACRYLAGKLIEAWSAVGNVDAQAHLAGVTDESSLVLDVTTDRLVIKARRQVIEHCLYGVDINPMAVEIAKLSLWIVSMDPDRPFTFVDDRLVPGDSLLGIKSIRQLEWMHLDPSAGRRLHKDTLLDYQAGILSLLKEVSRERERLVSIPGDDIADVNKKREILDGTQVRTEELIHYANLIVGAALAGSGKRAHWVTAAKTIQDAVAEGAVEEATEQGQKWLATDQPDGAFDRQPLHWPLVFPEVFNENRLFGPGFDAIIGNPPFLGGQKLTGSLGTAYREFLVNWIGHGVRGSADLIAYFLLRAHELLNSHGQTGLIATNTLAQGDTREVGLDQIVATGTEIRKAIKSKPWPSKSAVLEYAAIWTSRHLAPFAKRLADGAVVTRIAPSLDPASRVSGNPQRLVSNAELSFQGSIVLGLGFTMDPEHARELTARNPRNANAVFPYLNGQDLNSSPDSSASRWVINFHDWSEDIAKTYPELYSQVLKEVKPERDANKRKARRERWWLHAEPARGLYEKISGFRRVIAIARLSKAVMPLLVRTGQVMSDQIVVFATDDTGMLALLSSSLHYCWVIERGSTLETRSRYTPSDGFETLARPEMTSEARKLGGRLDTFRRELMVARQAGLTATYNLVHDQGCTDQDIAKLREIHWAIDEAVVRAYGWEDLLVAGLHHGFYETRQGPRYTIGPEARQEILDRLLELNHERYAAEVDAGLHKNAKKRAVQDISGDATLF